MFLWYKIILWRSGYFGWILWIYMACSSVLRKWLVVWWVIKFLMLYFLFLMVLRKCCLILKCFIWLFICIILFVNIVWSKCLSWLIFIGSGKVKVLMFMVLFWILISRNGWIILGKLVWIGLMFLIFLIVLFMVNIMWMLYLRFMWLGLIGRLLLKILRLIKLRKLFGVIKRKDSVKGIYFF